MNIRMNITTPSGAPRPFEHPGPVVRIGRDPAGELVLAGDDGKAVSWNHARIDLGAGGASITDLGSSNGTLLNYRKIEQPMPLRKGDLVHLGYTGATLQVVDLDLPAVVPPPAPQPLPRTGILAAGVVAAVLLLAGIVFLVVWSTRRPPSPVAEGPSAPAPAAELARQPAAVIAAKDPTPEPPAPQPAPPKPKDPPQNPAPPHPAPPRPKPPPEPAKDPLTGEVGTFVALKEWGPAVLLQRQSDAFPWLPVRPESRVSTAVSLVSLPGYRSTLALDSGLKVTLWGNLPEFSAFPPVLECAVMFRLPETGIDLDLTLERGRVHLANAKTAGAAVVQLRFLSQVWQLTLPEPGGEACAELWTLPGSATPNATPVVCLGLFTKGKVQLRIGARTLDLAERSRVVWVNGQQAAPQVDVLKELPEWWSKVPDRKKPEVADVLLSLADWAAALQGSNEVMDTIRTRIQESKDLTMRVVGLVFLAALDGVPILVNFLEDRLHPQVRGTARHAVQAWMTRRPENATDLQGLLEKQGYAHDKAVLACKLMRPLPPADLDRPETYQELIGYLDHENLLIRDLAFWHLSNLVPDRPPFDPAGDEKHRRQAIEQWKKRVPPGSVPRPAKR
jgi:hypothetical protein